MTVSHVDGMSVGLIARQVAMAASQGSEVDVARVLVERRRVREAGSTSSRQRPINRWWLDSGPFDTVMTGNTEKPRASSEPYQVLRANARSIASRSAGIDTNAAAGGSTSAQPQTSPKTPAEMPQIPKIAGPPFVVSDGASGRHAWPGGRPVGETAKRRKVIVVNVAIQATANGTGRRVKEVANQALGRTNRRHDSTSILSRRMSRITSPCHAIINTLPSAVLLPHHGVQSTPGSARIAEMREFAKTRRTLHRTPL